MSAPIATQLWLAWLAASLLCIATPGTDSLGTLSIGLARGRRQGVSFGIGVGLGCLTHTLWAALGISAAVAASETLFAAIKLAGAAYLLWLGVQCLRERGGARLDEVTASAGQAGSSEQAGQAGQVEPVEQAGTIGAHAASACRAAAGATRLDARALRQGFLCNSVNPKVMLFFMAFIPQFVDPAAGPVWLQMALFGTGFALLTGASYGLLGASAGRVGGWLRRRGSVVAWMNRLTGLLFIGLAVRLALAERR